VFTVKIKTINTFPVEITKMLSNTSCFLVGFFHAIIIVGLGNFAAVTSTK